MSTPTEKSPLPRPTDPNADAESHARPDVGADREAPAQPAGPDRGDTKVKKPPLGLEQIEDLEDDAKGG